MRDEENRAFKRQVDAHQAYLRYYNTAIALKNAFKISDPLPLFQPTSMATWKMARSQIEALPAFFAKYGVPNWLAEVVLRPRIEDVIAGAKEHGATDKETDALEKELEKHNAQLQAAGDRIKQLVMAIAALRTQERQTEESKRGFGWAIVGAAVLAALSTLPGFQPIVAAITPQMLTGAIGASAAGAVVTASYGAAFGHLFDEKKYSTSAEAQGDFDQLIELYNKTRADYDATDTAIRAKIIELGKKK